MEQVLAALEAPSRIRNVCVVAHVDHGKTSICDHLVASNGYIAAKLAGKTRYLDSREDEQQRLITIKSSSIPLLYRSEDQPRSEAYVVNLIDSPGHVDFSVEVSAATRLCDSALIVVDVIEGLRSQTKTVLRQAVLEGLHLLLVLNKMDRLFGELKMTPGNAYTHLRDVIENVNAYLNKCVQDSYLYTDTLETESHLVYENMAFEPGKGNVLFCSANDGWCFDLENCARRVLKTVTGSIDETKIPKIMTHCWGDWTLIPKKGQIVKRLGQPETTIAATQFLKPLEQIYRLGTEPLDSEHLPRLIQTVASHFDIPVQDRDIADWQKRKSNISASILHKWSPLGPFMLKSIVHKLPGPVESYKERMLRIKQTAVNSEEFEVTESSLEKRPCALFIAKSIHVNFEQNRLTCDCLHGRETANDFVGFSRVFEGTLKVGDVLYPTQEADSSTLEDDGDSKRSSEDSSGASMTVRKLYAPIGMDLVETTQVGPGAIVCVAFAEDSSQESDKSVKDTMTWLLSLASVQSAGSNRRAGGFSIVDRCVTLSSKRGSSPLLNIYTKHRIGAMRIGISPVNLRDWQDFVRGLALLYRADPAVTIDVIPETGEFVICCQGQVHHEKIIQDFKKLYCPGIELRMTPPLISLRESFQFNPMTTYASLSEQSFNVPFPPWAPTPTTAEAKAAFSKWQWNKAGQGAAACGTVSYVKAKAFTMSENLLRFLDAEATAVADIVHARRLSRAAVELIQKILHGLKGFLPDASQIKIKLTDAAAHSSVPDILESLTIAKCHSILFSCAEALANTTAECVAISVAGGGRSAAFLVPSQEAEPIPIIQDTDEEKAWLQDRMFLDNLSRESNLRAKPNSTPKGVYSIDSDSINRCKTSEAAPVSGSASTCDPKFTLSAAEKLDSMLKPQLRSSAALCVRHALDDITRRGPICEEPVRGVCWLISSMYTASQDEVNDGSRETSNFARDAPDSLEGGGLTAGSFHEDDGATTVQVSSIGPLIGTTRAAFRQGLLTRGCVRIWELMVKLEVSCSDSSLGRVHDLLGSRRGVVLSQAMLETTLEFVLLVEMPAGETFNLAVEMRRHASFIPITSYWKLNTEDPFEECALAQDLELLPSKGKMNTALKLVNSVRERKGLPTGQKVMEASADKQRTLKH